MATDVLVLFMFGIGTTAEHLSRLGDALATVAKEAVRSAHLAPLQKCSVAPFLAAAV